MLKESCVLLSYLSRALSQDPNGLDKFLEAFFNRECIFKVLHNSKTIMSEIAHACIVTVLETI